MNNHGFGFFQSVSTLLIVSMSLLFIFELTVKNMRMNNEVEQFYQRFNGEFNSYEVSLSQK